MSLVWIRLNLAELNRILADLRREGQRIVEAAGVPATDISVRLNIDMRYLGQGYEVRVPFPLERLTAAHIAEMQRVFEREYRAFYGQLAAGRANRGGELARLNQRATAANCQPPVARPRRISVTRRWPGAQCALPLKKRQRKRPSTAAHSSQAAGRPRAR